jgi:hypothetical protein
MRVSREFSTPSRNRNPGREKLSFIFLKIFLSPATIKILYHKMENPEYIFPPSPPKGRGM